MSNSILHSSLSLKHYLILYTTASPLTVYCEDFKGFKLLLAWLGPPQIEETNENENEKQLPEYLSSYQLWQLSKILGVSELKIFNIFLEIYRHDNCINS